MRPSSPAPRVGNRPAPRGVVRRGTRAALQYRRRGRPRARAAARSRARRAPISSSRGARASGAPAGRLPSRALLDRHQVEIHDFVRIEAHDPGVLAQKAAREDRRRQHVETILLERFEVAQADLAVVGDLAHRHAARLALVAKPGAERGARGSPWPVLRLDFDVSSERGWLMPVPEGLLPDGLGYRVPSSAVKFAVPRRPGRAVAPCGAAGA